MKALLIDFGNVIAFFDHRRACRALASMSARAMTADDVFNEVFLSQLEPDVDRGRIGSSEFLSLLRSQLQLVGTDEEVVRAWCDIFEPNAHIVAQLPALRKLAGRLVLVSNTNELHYRWIAREFAGPLAWFDAQVLSHQVGLRKPEPAMYAHAARLAGAGADECVFVDDKPEFVEAARAMSMRGILYTPGLDLVALAGADWP
ncbi:MAG TPA: HAD family phosphatase [Vicinamibacterales bacterium]|nr:HAD family phosphatase [Vicinamibacterales bacterium]